MDKDLIAWYPLDDEKVPGKDASGNGMDAVVRGENAPRIQEVRGRKAAVFSGGPNGSSYLQMPDNILNGVGDGTGFTVSAWICTARHRSPWERIIDFGSGMGHPYIFLTRSMRGVCFLHEDLAADAGRPGPNNEWIHVVLSVTGTKGGTLSSAGPRLYVGGELVGDGWISQTSSGTYKKLREWLETLGDTDNYTENYIGRSQFVADPDFCGAISDLRIYSRDLSAEEVLALMCRSLEPREILCLAKDKYLPAPLSIVNDDIELVTSLMDGQVRVEWSCDHPEVIAPNGKVTKVTQSVGVRLTASLGCGGERTEKSFAVSVIPQGEIPCDITIHGDRKVLDISPTLFGLFYEDINRSADGGLYAEMIQNRSFEEFHFDTYDPRSGENGISTGRVREPLAFWFGEIDKLTPRLEGGLRDFFGLEDEDAAACYVEVKDGTKIYNHGFCDKTFGCSMALHQGESYQVSVWAKTGGKASVQLTLQDEEGRAVSNTVVIEFEAGADWKKYYAQPLTAGETTNGKLELVFTGDVAIDMVSMMPEWVWGAKDEEKSATAHVNYNGNPNYRLRRDLVEALVEMHPSFLRFPGGCISEGSYIWDNVYDWKDSVDIVEKRKENFNVWGYTTTMGLGYMEYFQLSEDLGAEPLPVMACGVLCQARSDYANPAGGSLRDKYIHNFTDLIDFAISTDFEGNKWAALRKEMGHEAPFGLHYLGVGNENWGTEFYASFEPFKRAIDEHMAKNYPDYELHIISTAGAQADDTAYKTGWKFLAGYQKGTENIRFTDGKESWEENVSWYAHQPNYLDTIVDEHYYRSNDYLLENVDRYNYYYRPYKDGRLVEDQVSKVFVGEYASSDKNTLAGAIAEAAVMTGFERNSDVVRLAATAPLFNKVTTDGAYRWTPDAIWLDNESVWRTPTYYVQAMFAKYLGTRLLDTTYELYEYGVKKEQRPEGGILIKYEGGQAEFLELTVTSNADGSVLFEQDFSGLLSGRLKELEGNAKGWYIEADDWYDYKVTLKVRKIDPHVEISVGAGLRLEVPGNESLNKATVWEYCVGKPGIGTGLRVIKDGKEGYTMGDYSSSVFAGNLRACYDEHVAPDEYTITVDFGGGDGRHLRCSYAGKDGVEKAVLENKLERYIRDLYHSVTEDDEKIYVKLVNTDGFDKSCLLKLDGVKVRPEAETIVLTGDEAVVHMPNVNVKWREQVKPVESQIRMGEQGLAVAALANSLTVVVLEKES